MNQETELLFPVSDPSTYLSCRFSKTTLHHETKRPPLNTDAIPIHFYLRLVNVAEMQKKKKEREREKEKCMAPAKSTLLVLVFICTVNASKRS